MNSRMNKYYDDEVEVVNSRYQRNEELYKEINKNELSKFDIKSNATVIGDNKNEIDIEKIKKILDTRYNETPKRSSIRLVQDEEIEEEREITKEYDINIILEKAKEQKQDNYEEERLKKLRDTQFDILKNLNIEKRTEQEIEFEEQDDLKKLLNTIAFNENKNKQNSEELDLLSDLKGGDDTEVLEGLKEKIDKEENTEEQDLLDTKMINSFYTSSNSLEEKDFEDMEEFSKGIESNNLFIKIAIILIILVFLAGVALLIKTIYF